MNVTGLALAEMRRRLSNRDLGGFADEEDVVREFVRLEVSYGEESYWDPLRYPELELNGDALQ